MRANVLFVEDEEALRMTVGDRLRNEGYAVECAADGDEGFEKATQIPSFNMLELMARVEALLRRAPSRPVAQTRGFDFGSIHVDLVGTEATRNGEVVNLSAREFQLLRYFIERRGATLSREELLRQVWGYSADMYTRTVDVHVASLRQKLEEDPKQPKFILTVQGLGYKFKP